MSETTLPLTPAQILVRLAGMSPADAQDALLQIAKAAQPPGLRVATAVTLGQVQAAVGLRRATNPFGY